MSFVLTRASTLLLLILLILIAILIPTSGFLNKKERSALPNFSTAKFLPRQIENLAPPELSAKSALVVDVESETVIFEKNSNLRIPPASLTKLATALVTIENCPQDKIITVPKIATPAGSKMGLTSGEKITVENLLYGLLLPSGNDAANVLVSNCFANFEDFLSTVTNLTQKLGMVNTQFKNPTGLPAKGHFSTANDLLKLTKAALKNNLISQIAATKEKTVTDLSGKISHKLTNLNKLLDDPSILGVKTGRSSLGENLITLKRSGNHQVISIILQSPNRFAETEKILNWVFENFVWEPKVF